MEITHGYKYLGIDLYLHGHVELSSKMWSCMYENMMGTLRKEAIVGVTCSRLSCLQHSYMALEFGELT